MQAVQAAQAALEDFDALPPLGQDAVSYVVEKEPSGSSWDSKERGIKQG